MFNQVNNAVAALTSFIDEMKDKTEGAISTPLHNPARLPRRGGKHGVNFTDTQFTFNTSTLLSVSVHLRPFSCSPRPFAAIKPNTALYLNPCLLWAWVSKPLFILLIIFFPLLTANLAPSHSLARFLSPSLSCHDTGLWHVWETFVGPLLQKGHWYTESAGWLGYFWNCKYENFLS